MTSRARRRHTTVTAAALLLAGLASGLGAEPAAARVFAVDT